MCETKNRLFVSRNHESIKRWGEYQKYIKTDLSGSEADNFVAQDFEKSEANIQISVSTLGNLYKTGVKAYVFIPSLQIDDNYIIQSVKTTIGGLAIGGSNIELSNKAIEKRWQTPFKNARMIEAMKKEREFQE